MTEPYQEEPLINRKQNKWYMCSASSFKEWILIFAIIAHSLFSEVCKLEVSYCHVNMHTKHLVVLWLNVWCFDDPYHILVGKWLYFTRYISLICVDGATSL